MCHRSDGPILYSLIHNLRSRFIFIYITVPLRTIALFDHRQNGKQTKF